MCTNDIGELVAELASFIHRFGIEEHVFAESVRVRLVCVGTDCVTELNAITLLRVDAHFSLCGVVSSAQP